MKIAHISDLHFASWDWDFSQIFSKRLLGTLNFLFGRRHQFDYARLKVLPGLFRSLDISTVMITGDLSTTSNRAEFSLARDFVQDLKKNHLEVFCIPGNHDHYTQKAYRKRLFYDYFPSCFDSHLSLKEEGISMKQLGGGWWIIGLDTALATSWVQSTGYFHPKTEKALSQALEGLPQGDRVILMNHFPLFQHEPARKQLKRAPVLQRLIEQYPAVKIYCHGHTHRRCLANLQASQLPLILDTGSTTSTQHGGWYLLDLAKRSVCIEWYQWHQTQWMASLKEMYDLV